MDPDGSIRGATDPVSGEDMINEYANIFPNVAVLCVSILISAFFFNFSHGILGTVSAPIVFFHLGESRTFVSYSS